METHLLRRLLLQHDEPLERGDPRVLVIAEKLERQDVDRCLVVERILLGHR